MSDARAGEARVSVRRGSIDVARAAALFVVVLGHLTLAVIDRGPDGAVRGANILSLYPHLAWLTIVAPMPVFFAVTGWANSNSTVTTAARRLRALLGMATVVVCVWAGAAIVERLVVGHSSIVTTGARIATQPLWFLAAYLPFSAGGTTVARIARRPWLSIGGCLGVLVVLDAARFGFGAPRIVGWPGFYAAWGVPCLLGAWWRTRWESGRRDERRIGVLLLAASVAVAVVLVNLCGYNVSLIDGVPGSRSNTTPPTLYMAVVGLGQVGVLMMVAARLDPLRTRWKRFFDRAGAATVGLYVWHLSALAICVAVIVTGWWAPRRLTASWWAFRPAWYVIVLATTGVFVVLTAWVQGRGARPLDGEHPSSSTSQSALGLLCATIGAAIVGLIGPRNLVWAVIAFCAFLTSWVLLGWRRRASMR